MSATHTNPRTDAYHAVPKLEQSGEVLSVVTQMPVAPRDLTISEKGRTTPRVEPEARFVAPLALCSVTSGSTV